MLLFIFSLTTEIYPPVVGMGTVPFTFNLQESMQDPSQMMKATNASLWTVCTTYILTGEIISIIFWPTLHGFQTDMLSTMPHASILSVIIKVSMSLVILSSIPLIIVPFGDLIQAKLIRTKEQGWGGLVLRISLCIICALISIVVPNFVYVISFIGCFCVALISYTLPALAHIFCLLKLRKGDISLLSKLEWGQLYLDCILVPIGLISCILTSDLTFKEMIRSISTSS